MRSVGNHPSFSEWIREDGLRDRQGATCSPHHIKHLLDEPGIVNLIDSVSEPFLLSCALRRERLVESLRIARFTFFYL